MSGSDLTAMEMQRIRGGVATLRADLLRDTAAAVAIPSVTGNEQAMQAFVARLWQDAGLDVQLVAPDIERLRGLPGFIETRQSYAGRANVIARRPGDPAAPSLILNGHVDVVSPGDLAAWRHDPWSGVIEGDWLYGRGSGDMKAGLIAAFYALRVLDHCGLHPRGTVMLQAVIDEEAGGAGGTLACLAEGYRADAMICVEPHGTRMTLAHTGVAYFRVLVRGRAAHAGQAHLGVNAITAMARIVLALEALDLRRRAALRHPLIGGAAPAAHLNIGTMRAGDWPSSVPDSAGIECRIGFIPGESLAEIRALVAATLHEVAASDPWLRDQPPEVTWFGWQAEPWEQDPQHPFVAAVGRAITQVTGQPAQTGGRSAGLDTRFAGMAGMAALCIGPLVENMHGVDERVNIPSILTAVEILAATILEWCGRAEEPANA